MNRKAAILNGCVVAVASLFVMEARTATGQEIRVLVIRPTNAKEAVPADALHTFRQAILDAVPGVGLVATAAEATDLVELTRYEWSPDSKFGVTQTWQFFFHPLEKPDVPPTALAKPAGFVFVVPGKTLAESTEVSSEKLRRAFRQLLPRFRPVVPK